MSYLCDLFLIFSLIFIVINQITSFKKMNLFFVHYLEYPLLFVFDNVDEESECRSLASGCCLVFFYFFYQFQTGVAYKSVAYKKACKPLPLSPFLKDKILFTKKGFHILAWS